jgi:anthranilate phosphoribosyltransferase
VLERLGTKRAMVVWGKDGMDEITLGAATMVGELRDGVVREYEIQPEDFGLSMSSSRNLVVADANESRAKILEVLDNKSGVARDIVMLNSGAALYTAGLAASIGDGVAKARESLASGAARARLDQFIKTTQRLKA